MNQDDKISSGGGNAAPAITVTEFRVPTDDPGVTLYLRNKRPADGAAFAPGRTLLFVHGATYAASVTFDMALDGVSWMDVVAGRGFDVWALDLRGYGHSSRPAAMEQPAEANPPLVDSSLALADCGRAIDFILAHRAIDQLQLIGYSWGSLIAGAFAAANPARVERLVLYAALFLQEGGASLIGGGGTVPAYRLVGKEDARARWLHGVTPDARDDLVPATWVEEWLDAGLALDPRAGEHDPPKFRAPAGVVGDAGKYWLAGRPFYDPGRIVCPTLVIVGEWDIETPPKANQRLFEALSGAPHKRFVQLGRMTHAALLERRRHQLFGAVQSFLEERF